MGIDLQRRLFTADEYHRMGEAGVFRPDDRVELVEGEIVEMTPIGSNGLLTSPTFPATTFSVRDVLGDEAAGKSPTGVGREP